MCCQSARVDTVDTDLYRFIINLSEVLGGDMNQDTPQSAARCIPTGAWLRLHQSSGRALNAAGRLNRARSVPVAARGQAPHKAQASAPPSARAHHQHALRI